MSAVNIHHSLQTDLLHLLLHIHDSQEGLHYTTFKFKFRQSANSVILFVTCMIVWLLGLLRPILLSTLIHSEI